MKEWLLKLVKQKDKQMHFIGSVIMSIAFASALIIAFGYWISVLASIVIAGAVGVGKERFDGLNPRKHTEDINDLYADMLV